MSADDPEPNSRVAAPLTSAVPDPMTAPLIVMFPPFAPIRPEFATSLLIIRLPLPVASSVQEFSTAFGVQCR